MKKKFIDGVSATMSRMLNLALCSTLAFSPLTPALADDALNMHATVGNTASALPDVDNVCTRLNDAASGNFVNTDGTPLLVTKDDCLGLSRRERNEPRCKITVSDLTRGMSDDKKRERIDQLCQNGGSLGQAGDAYCNLRQIGKNSQSLDYCKAYEASSTAEKGLKRVLALDAAAAGICWAEYLTTKAQVAAGGSLTGNGVIKDSAQMGICGGAAIAAGLAEIIQVMNVAAVKDEDGLHKNFSGRYKIDENSNVKSRDRGFFTMKAFQIISSSVLSLAAIRAGICYYKPDTKVGGLDLCQGLDNAQKKAAPNTALADNSECKDESAAQLPSLTATPNQQKPQTPGQIKKAELAAKCATAKQRIDADRGVGQRTKDFYEYEGDAAKAKDGSNLLAKANKESKNLDRMEMAGQAAKIFTGLAAMRATSIYYANKTKKDASALLQSMFQGGTSGPSFGASAVAGNGGNMFAATAAVGFPNTITQPTRSGATAELPPGSVESFLTPPGSPLGNAAEQIAKQIPDSKLDAAASGGAGGASGLIASTASALGAKGDLSPIHSTASTVFANLPKEESGYSSSGGAPRMAGGSKDGAGDLNLKSLFGGGDKEGEATSPGRTDIAFREPAAAEDIWHSQNPSGNNLFQIISSKYDHVQRRSGVGEGL